MVENEWMKDAENLTQEEFMKKDLCFVLDENDNVIQHEDQYRTHDITQGTLLHR